MLSGLILAGGRSTRMGRDKAGIVLPDGRTLVERQADILRAVGVDMVFVSVRRGTTGLPRGLSMIFDAVPDAGPLAGVAAGLRAASAGMLIVLAVDMPGIEAAHLEELVELSTDSRGSVPVLDGQMEPLAAVYPTILADSAAAALATENRAVAAWAREEAKVGRVRLWDMTGEWARALRSWNTPEDMASLPPW